MSGVQPVPRSARLQEQYLEEASRAQGLFASNGFDLDPSLLATTISDEELAFFKKQTGIEDTEELKDHILNVQREAYNIFPYPCIRSFSFLKLKVSHFPAYKEVLRLGKERPGALFLDIGCCFGNDVRKAVGDGFPANQAIGSDIRPEFWDLGYKLFKDTPETFPATFIPGDALDPNILSIGPDPNTSSTSTIPDLSTLTSLNTLHGKISAIHASSFFHLFDESKQLHLAKALASLLSPEPGSVILGSHGGYTEKKVMYSGNDGGDGMLCHSPESWKEMWEQEVFGGEEGKARVWATLKEVEYPVTEKINKWYLLIWSVTRL